LLRYGVSRVPELEQEIQDGAIQTTPANRKDVSLIASLSGIEQAQMQRPVLFDFALERSDVALIGNSPTIAVPNYSAYTAPPDEEGEQRDYIAAVEIADSDRQIAALRDYLLKYPLSKQQTRVRAQLLKTLIATHAASNEILGVSESLLDSLRDTSDEALAVRYIVMVTTASALESNVPSTEAARELAYEALMTARDANADPGSDVKALYQRLLQRSALTIRSEQLSVDALTRETLGIKTLTPGVVLYGAVRGASGAGIADVFEKERGSQSSIAWLRYTPQNDETRIRLGERLKVSDTPAILLLDQSGVVRFRDEAYSPDLRSILQLQVDALLQEVQHAARPQ
jgi:hypothetical protein